MRPGTFFGVSVGPGDPELITMKAAKTIDAADVIAFPGTLEAPGIAYGIVEKRVARKPLLPCPAPMSHDRDVLSRARAAAAERICAELARGHDVAYLCLGDVAVYSSYSYLAELVQERGYPTRAVAGVTSFCAAAAELGVPLCKGDEPLVIVPRIGAGLEDVLDVPANKVFLKVGGYLEDLRRELLRRGQLENASAIERCGLEGQRVIDLAEDSASAAYLTVALVREGR
jgi:precorrin-2/cobalt-factor-2 C20-methyltransferase